MCYSSFLWQGSAREKGKVCIKQGDQQQPAEQQQEEEREEEGQEDSDSWMEAQGAVIEQELSKRQAEMEAGPLGGAQSGGGGKPVRGKAKRAGCVLVEVSGGRC